MQRGPARSEDEETGRETRLKLILLAVAVVLVAGYAMSITAMGDVVLWQVARVMQFGVLPVFLATVGAVAFVAVLFVAIRWLRRWAVARSTATEPEVALGGRSDFLQALREELGAQKSGRRVAIHVIDIDRFRTLNEALGEVEGDAFLRLVGERLMIVVDRPERLARIGDDEFAVIQPDPGGARGAEIYARRLEEALNDACAQMPRHARPTASIGIAVSADDEGDPIKLLHGASLALHAAKKAGGNTLRVYAREMEMAVESRLQMERAISEGLHHGWFELHFQPQYDLGTRRLTGFEALVRMRHPKLGVVPPTAFVPVADDSGLIQPLGEWIINEAIQTAAAWPRHVTLSINISLAQFRSGDAAGRILQAISHSKFEGSRLRIEVSEAVFMVDSLAINEQLKRLKKAGVSIVLDDFGLDTSKLSLLSRLPCDAVKLDRSLIEQVGAVPEIDGLVRSLIGTAQSFDLDISAEGIERAEQAQFLMSHDCQKVQGFLFGRPTPAGEVAAIIAKDRRNAVNERSKSSTAAA